MSQGTLQSAASTDPVERNAEHAAAPDPRVRAQVKAKRRRALLKTLLRSLGNAAITLITLLVIWQCVVSFAGISTYIAKGPLDVWNFLFTDEGAGEHRSEMFALLWHTLVDAGIGFALGLFVAVVLAIVFSLSRAVEAGVMPLVLLLRAIPLVSIAPVIILITGRATTASVAVMGTIVVLFPALANVMFGLTRASRQSLDVVHVFGGGRLMALRKVNLPGALPSLFAAARVSVPGAVTGALLAEWLSTGLGVGGSILKFNAQAQFTQLWTSIALITIVTLVLYNLVQILENVVLTRMGMTDGER